ncbi:MAG: CvpA family protein, partial [Planctomycetes bacterium]|nr:CvpA family protein [Planctomycetota bacterium]
MIIDLVIILLLALGIWVGVRTGLIRQVMRLLAVILSIYISIFLHAPIAGWLGRKMDNPYLVTIITYFIILAGIYLALFFLTIFLEKLMEKWKVKKFDKIGGGILSFFKTALVCGVILLVLLMYPVINIKKSWCSSYVLIYTRSVVLLMP